MHDGNATQDKITCKFYDEKRFNNFIAVHALGEYPIRGQTGNTHNKRNHFSRMCRSEQKEGLHIRVAPKCQLEEYQGFSYDSKHNFCQTQTIGGLPIRKLYVNAHIENWGRRLRALFDTEATCDVMVLKICKRLSSRIR